VPDDGPLRRRFVEELTEQAAADDPPYSLDYCRLNIRVRRPEADCTGSQAILNPAA
jgi:hypothetical protein